MQGLPPGGLSARSLATSGRLCCSYPSLAQGRELQGPDTQDGQFHRPPDGSPGSFPRIFSGILLCARPWNMIMGRQSDPCPQECRPEWMPSLSDQEIRFSGCLFPQLLDPSMSQRETVGVINLRRTTIPESSTRTWPSALIPGLAICGHGPLSWRLRVLQGKKS